MNNFMIIHYYRLKKNIQNNGTISRPLIMKRHPGQSINCTEYNDREGPDIILLKLESNNQTNKITHNPILKVELMIYSTTFNKSFISLTDYLNNFISHFNC